VKTALLFLVASCCLAAQWLNHPTQGIPRSSDGRPNLSAPAPRGPDGRLDLSGIWQVADPKYLANIAVDLKPGAVPFQPWAEKLFNERKALLHASEESNAHCLPPGVPRVNATPNPFKIVPMPGETVILYEAFGLYRQIFTDGRPLPKDPQPSWQGYSAGKWQGDTLVVDTIGFNGQTWLDQAGHPITDAFHLTEGFHRRDAGHMDVQITIDDPKAYARAWTITEKFELLPDTELIEFVCENEKDVSHLERIKAAGNSPR
jgi:hypothetical protein